MARRDPQVNIRLPELLKARLDQAARGSGRSLTAEIVQRLEQSFEQAPPDHVERMERAYAEWASSMKEMLDEERGALADERKEVMKAIALLDKRRDELIEREAQAKAP